MSDVWRAAHVVGERVLTSAYGDQVADEESGRKFGALLREYRLARELRQEDVAEQSGVSLSTINRWERGVIRNPVPDELRAVCSVVGLSTVAAGIALGYLAPEDVEHLPEPPRPVDPFEEEAAEILRDSSLTRAERDAALHYLRYLKAQATANAQRPGTDQSRAAS